MQFKHVKLYCRYVSWAWEFRKIMHPVVRLPFHLGCVTTSRSRKQASCLQITCSRHYEVYHVPRGSSVHWKIGVSLTCKRRLVICSYMQNPGLELFVVGASRLNNHQTEWTAICEWPRVVLIYSRMDINWRNKLNLAGTNASKTIIDICITCKPVLWSASPGALNIQTRSQNKKIDAQCMLKRWPFFQVITKAKNLLHNLCRVSDNPRGGGYSLIWAI